MLEILFILLGDFHIYEEHFEQVEIQLERDQKSPELQI